MPSALPSTPQPMVDGGGAGPRSSRASTSACPSDDLRELAHDDAEDLEFLRSLGMRSAITVALQARGEVTGALTLGVGWSGRRYRRERRPLRLDPLRPRRAGARQLRPLRRPRARRAGAGRDRRDAAARPAAVAAAAHPRLVGRRDVPAGRRRERGRRRLLRRLPGAGWLDAGDRRRHRPRRAGRLDHRASPATRCAPPRFSPTIPWSPCETLNRALLARGDSALCSLAAMTLSEDPLRAGAARGRRPPAAAAGRRRERQRGRARRPGARRLRTTPSGGSRAARSSPASSS